MNRNFHHKNRPFNQSAFNKFDKKGRLILQSFLHSKFGATNFVDNDESFFSDNYYDFSCEIQGILCKFEVEFSTERFRYLNTGICHVPERKYKNKANYICCVNDQNVWICNSKHVKDSSTRIFRIKGILEEFFEVPWNLGFLYSKNGGRWTSVKQEGKL